MGKLNKKKPKVREGRSSSRERRSSPREERSSSREKRHSSRENRHSSREKKIGKPTKGKLQATDSRKSDSSKKRSHSRFSDVNITTKGLGLSAKLSIIITLVSAIITIAAGAIIASQTGKLVKHEIIKGGIVGVKEMAVLGRTLIYSNIEVDKSDPQYLKSKISNSISSSGLTDLLTPFFNTELQSPVMDGYITLTETGGKPVRFLVIDTDSDNKEKKINTQLNYGNWKIESQDFDLPSIKIQSATMSRDGKQYSVYEFKMDLDLNWEKAGINFEERGAGYKPDRGEARLFLSTSMIEKAVGEINRLTCVILAISVALSILIALWLSTSITRPIIQLVQDMHKVSHGDLDHKTVAHSTDEVGFLSTTFNHLTENLKHAQETEIEKEKLEHDMAVGREIQQTLLPKGSQLQKIPGYDHDEFYLSAKEVGGDYYDLIPVDKSHLGVVVADVSGKGIQGAMIMTIVRTVMNIAVVKDHSSKASLAKTNRVLSDRIKRGMFVTAFYAILDIKNHTLKFSSAGHNPMIIYRSATKELELLNPTGIALGFDKGPLFERTIKEAETTMEKGDRFLMYTDGVVEAMNEARKEYTDQRLYDFVKSNSHYSSKKFVQNLVADIKKHQGHAPQHDDITIVTFRKT